MTQVQILTQCSHCKGDAYLPVGETIDSNGQPYTRHRPCPNCQGGGKETCWISLQEFAVLLESEKCPHDRTTTHGSFHLTASEVWDDIHEVCSDCGAVIG